MSTTTPSPASTRPASRGDDQLVHRVEVHPTAHAGDPRAQGLIARARALGFELEAAHSARVYLIEAPLTDAQLERIVTALLTNPVVERAYRGSSESRGALVEVHPLPGVMDPPAQSVAEAIESLIGIRPVVSTGYRYDMIGVSDAQAQTIAARLLANPVVAGVHAFPFHPEQLPKGRRHEFKLTHVSISALDDAGLGRLSREGHLFLSLQEMRAIRDEYRTLGREPTDIELETLAQTWSEHCVHKTLKATINYTGPAIEGIDSASRPHHVVNPDGSVTINNLLRATVAAATFELIEEGLDWAQSVFVDNAGIIRFDDQHSVCIKVETHNHPSALEPYGGAATGIGGCIRDIIGTGLAARPIASTDVFCVARPDAEPVPPGCLPPRQVLTQVVAGVRDYGNRMGIPTINGAVYFDRRYIGNPLVFCGCIGIMPSHLIRGDAQAGDRIIALGGRTGRDGIHGATFSSAELTDTHADEFSHAVQIGNAIEEKRTLDAILRARDAQGGPLFSAITDCGAGGFSSAVGEMGEKIGAFVELDKAPLKYAGLSYTEIWISEAQERMVLAVPERHLAKLQEICDEEHVELANLGYFGTDGAELILNFEGHEVGRLPMHFLHDGIPMPTRTALWEETKSITTEHAEHTEAKTGKERGRDGEGQKDGFGHLTDSSPTTRTSSSSHSSLSSSGSPSVCSVVNASPPMSPRDALLALLAHPNIASKHWIIRQYDHQVQGNTVIKPLVGPRGVGPGDASVIEPVPGTGRGLSVGCGLATGLSDDPYLMTLSAIDECVRNLVCVGTDPERIAILDNFCWPSCTKPENLGSLVRAAHACYDGAKAYRTPFVSGKDSLNNQFTVPGKDGAPDETIEIPPTLLITGMGIVHDLEGCVTSDAKTPGNTLILVGAPQGRFTGSHAQQLGLAPASGMPRPDLRAGPAAARGVHRLIRSGLVRAAHDVSDGGVVCAIAEMLIAGSSPQAPIGFAADASLDWAIAYDESPSCYVLEVRDPEGVRSSLGDTPWRVLGELDDSGVLRWGALDAGVEETTRAWRGTLDW